MDTGIPNTDAHERGPIAGDTRVQAAVGRAWTRTLDRQSLADDVPFDEAGGDSLRFLILVFHMEEQLGTALPLDLFDLSMSPRAVCAAVERHISGGAPEVDGEQPEVFLLPGIGGDEPRLVRFRDACSAAFRIVPVDYGDWHDWVRPGFDMDQLLARVTADIAARAPSGPLMLAGYSLGGFMAYVVAARLAEAGRTIRAIGLLDASNLGAASGSGATPAERIKKNDELHQIVAGFQSGIPGNALARAVVRRLASPRWERLLPAATRLSNARLPWDFGYYLRGHLRIGLLTKFLEHHRAHFAPLPALASVPLVLLRSDLRQADQHDLGWAGYGQSVSVMPVPGDHFNMFDPPHLQEVAARFIDGMRPFVPSRGG